MSKLAMPPVNIPRNDHARLLNLAHRARLDGHPVAEFLLSEIARAQVLDGSRWEDELVALNRWITYRVDWGPTESRVLVHPEEYVSAERQLSVLSPVGAALIGIKAGERMPFIAIDGTLHIVTVISIDRAPRILNFARRTPDQQDPQDGPFDPGPTAA